MADTKHLYLVTRGTYTEPRLAKEVWQFGVRLWVDQAVPADEGELPTIGDFHEDSIADSGGGRSYVSNWGWSTIAGEVINQVSYMDDQVTPYLNGLFSAPLFSQKVILGEVKVYPIGSNGKAFEGRSGTLTFTDIVHGGRGTDMVPTEVSVAVSFNTHRPGRKGRGRVYQPPTSQSAIADDGFLDGTFIGDTRDAWVAALQALAVESVDPAGLHVRPIVTGRPWQNYAVITSIDIGDVFDAQRRRRNRLDEIRFAEDVTYS
jgi:hypothetical protein